MQVRKEPNDETWLTSARILPSSLLFVRPSVSRVLKFYISTGKPKDFCPGCGINMQLSYFILSVSDILLCFSLFNVAASLCK